MAEPATTPKPPYFAVIFTSVRNAAASGEADDGYEKTAQRMLDLASRQPGFLGFETAREDIGISVSYWADEASIRAWKTNADHVLAQQRGKQHWYQCYRVRVCRVEREYGS
ncbi:MAG: antibiotic biosynthesis monooxygenase [Burkholderiales bacterium]